MPWVFVHFFKLYISELHLDDVYEDFDFDKSRWNDRNGCFESQTEGVGGRDNNSIIIIITIVIIMIVIMIIFFTIIIIKDLRLRAVEITATGCCESHFPPFPLKPCVQCKFKTANDRYPRSPS